MPPPSFLDQQQREGSLTRTPIATGEGLIQKPARMSPSDSAVAAKASSLERTRASDKSDRSSMPKSAVPASASVSSAETATATSSPDSTVSTSRVGRPAAEAATSQAAALLVAEPLGGRASDPVARSGTQAATMSKPSTGRTPPQVPSKPLHLQLRAAGSVPAQPTQPATGGVGSPTSAAWGIAALSAHTIVRLSRDLMIILTSKGIVPQ